MKNLDSKMEWFKIKAGKLKTQKIKIKTFLKIKSFQNILWIKNLEDIDLERKKKKLIISTKKTSKRQNSVNLSYKVYHVHSNINAYLLIISKNKEDNEVKKNKKTAGILRTIQNTSIIIKKLVGEIINSKIKIITRKMIMMINRNYKIPKIIIKMNKKYKITKILIRENKILILIVKRKKKYKIKKIIIKMNKKNKITKIIIMVKGKIKGLGYQVNW